MTEEKSYNVLRKSNTDIIAILSFYLERLLNQVRRRLSPHKSRTITVKVGIPPEIFLPWVTAVDRHSTRFHSKVDRQYSSLGRGHRVVSKASITFTHRKAFIFHLRQVILPSTASSIIHYLSATFKNGGTTKVEISEDKPAVFNYVASKGVVTLSCQYCILNRFQSSCI